ncbi:MAG: DUF3472 domain-containing protein [Pirellulaceae bacterium]
MPSQRRALILACPYLLYRLDEAHRDFPMNTFRNDRKECLMISFLIRRMAILIPLLFAAAAQSAEWSIPVGGNAFRTAPEPGGNAMTRDGGLTWRDADEVFSVYFHVDRPANLKLALRAETSPEGSTLIIRVAGQEFATTLLGGESTTHPVGRIDVSEPGYVQVEIQGRKRTGRVFAEIRDLLVTTETADLKLDFVKSNEGNMFYWGRRGPSVHLTYVVPEDRKLQYAYSEITVPEGEDTIGSYFMANGFGEGYFGIQVNNSRERRVLFSVWSPFQTDNPRDIPEDQRVVRLASGPDVRVGEFGNEGSGGQSFLVYPWKAGVTYRFLTEVKPDGPESTRYTAWFGDKSAGEWRLIASFRRPQTSTHLRRFHSFLENFNPAYGHISRRALHGNVWVNDIEGQWHECTQARFSVDATGRGGHRLDFTGGADGEYFFMQNCGFFSETGRPGAVFTRDATPEQKPEIDFDALPQG